MNNSNTQEGQTEASVSSQEPNHKKTLSFSKGYTILEREGEKALPAPLPPDTQSLPIDKINLMESVFQRRLFLGAVTVTPEGLQGQHFEEDREKYYGAVAVTEMVASEQHVRDLQEAIMNSHKRLLDEPITVWWSGKKWYCIDGHHRLLAYRRLKNQGREVPRDILVSILQGDVEEALKAAIRLNSKAKLNMTRPDKLEAAWLMVKMQKKNFTVSTIATTAKVSPRTVDNMRAKFKAISESHPEMTQEELQSITWEDALNGVTVKRDWTPDKLEQLAIDWRNRISRAFGKKFAMNPDIAARALELYSPTLVGRLSDIWAEPEDTEF